ncbi:type I-E CRISPR-associated protein Cse1/CasA [Endozoicomonas sp.]|uniref:type I-E CRISPR-associated protein Cse1/CasA n=1 Tax=Endozoicomonas sp. TaxID=1892382 RepID=UPI002885E5A0|nr:type I-E CRISPR-associated protein Cse1/CasA [Endozoicomonas sp.]
MNLINDPWIPVLRANGSREKITPWKIAEAENPVVEIAAPRPDFQGALYQFLIGLLQTAFAPENEDGWQECWETPPDESEFKTALEKLSPAFELINPEGSAFLQDFDMPDGELKPLAGLLIEAPGGKTLKDNLDHFVKGGTVEGACLSCAATALFTLQANAPAGGVGHRVGLRGGGPLTTLVMPQNDQSTLWQKLWLNVLSNEDFEVVSANGNENPFPWMCETRHSDNKGVTTEPQDVSPLQMYWGMPRRIRFASSDLKEGDCTLCGCQSSELLTHYRTKNYGTNYDGPWLHPLTPYRFDPKKVKPPLTLKGQQGGLGYRHWLGLSCQDDNNGDQAAKITRLFNEERAEFIAELAEVEELPARLWCFGYDMDNMKARCWYDHQMPLLNVADDYRDNFILFVSQILAAAKDAVFLLRGQVKAGWFNRPSDAKGDTSMVDHSFWQATEPAFYELLHSLSNPPENTRHMPSDVARHWLTTVRKSALDLFDEWVLSGDAEDLDMKRITKARRILKSKLITMKSLKELDQIASDLSFQVPAQQGSVESWWWQPVHQTELRHPE